MNEIIVTFVKNMALLLATSILCVVVPTEYLVFSRALSKRRIITQIISGIVIGSIGIITMLSPIELMEGLFFDVRSILICTSGLVFSGLPTIIGAVLVGGFRLLQGGIGMVPGTVQVVLMAAFGMLWRHFRLKKLIGNRKKRWAELYIFGVLAHLLVLSTFLLLPPQVQAISWQNVGIPIIVIFPIGVVLLGLILFSQIDNYNTMVMLEESKSKLSTMLMSVGEGIVASDKQGNTTLINQVAEDVLGYKASEVLGKPVESFLKIADKNETGSINPIQEVLSTERIICSANQRILIKKDGSQIPITDNAAPIRNANGDMTGAVLVIRDATAERIHLERINYLAYHDVLTGLYSRHYFEEETKRLDTERNLPISVIIGDVNGLKLTNDAFGHDMGDLLLKEMANSFRRACRKDDIVARWGGDEFIVLLPNTDYKAVERINARIMESCCDVKISNIKFSIALGYDTKASDNRSIAEVIKSAEDYMYRKKTTESSSIRGNTIITILHTLHEKNKREQMHSDRVSELCKRTAQVMNLSEKEINELELAGLLHDIGKIAISDDILNKEGKLTPEEWIEIKRHPEIGYRILSTSNSMSYIAKYVLSHHERLDGKGYPFGISEKQIPLQSRVIAVADMFDAMTSQRTYRTKVTKQEAIKEMIKCSGTQLDAEIVKIFVEKVLEQNIEELQ